MNLTTFLFKMEKRTRRCYETLLPSCAFAYKQEYCDPVSTFTSWLDAVPYDPSFNLNTVLPTSVKQELLQKADLYCSKSFYILGSSFSFPSDIDWHLDFKSGFRWPANLVHTKIRSATPEHADLKTPWELSRFHHAITLSLAYRVSGSEEYLQEFKKSLKSWIECNPTGLGVNWTCPMDVAIRAVNWLIAIALLGEALFHSFYDDFLPLVLKSLWDHGEFLRNHLEWNGPNANSGANHLLCNLAGLFTIGVFFSTTCNGNKWMRFAHSQIANQAHRQVLSDGVHFERSPAYHRLCTELFLWSNALANSFDYPFPDSFTETIHKMQNFPRSYMKPSGIPCSFGDNDSGRFIAPFYSTNSDHSYLGFSASEESQFVIDRYLVDGTKYVSGSCDRNSSFPDGGFYFFSNTRAHLSIRAGMLAYDGTHAHNDQLSFELTLDNRDVFVDRGTGSYLSRDRDFFRSTSSHNTFQINNAEQNPLGPGLFDLADDTQTTVEELGSGRLKAYHVGFRSLSRSAAKYCRAFSLADDSLVIEDSFDTVEKDDLNIWYFHLAPGLSVYQVGSECRILSSAKHELCVLSPSQEMDCIIRKSKHSCEYGEFASADTICYSSILTHTDDSRFSFTILWRGSPEERCHTK